LVGPAIHHLAEFEPSILIQALVYTAIAFTSFSVISLFSKRRSYLYLGGLIMTLVQGMLLYRFVGWMFGYSAYNMIYLMFGLFVACLYIIYDTQVIVEKAERGDRDIPTHTMTLFIDLFELFIRIIQILIKLNEDKNKNERRRRND
jgi:FtsH-binding integral membrane protein